MALYAFDGTWNEDEGDSQDDTNVVRFRDAYQGANIEYIEGVGTRFGAVGRFFGGIFGIGGRTRIEEMYERLVENWKQGDKDIDIIGFSRGAALALHFSHVVSEYGVRLDEDTVLARPPVRFLGVWDIVGSFGIPIDVVLDFQDINLGYDLKLHNNVQHCFHAMALNERRQAFNVTRLDIGNQRSNAKEVWFRGMHSDVGGGNGKTALSSISLKWMLENARACGLPVNEQVIAEQDAKMDPTAPLYENRDPIENESRRVLPTDRFHPGAVGRKLEPGETHSFVVRAPEQYSWSGVRVAAGEHYAFLVDRSEEWRDKSITCSAAGWKTEDLPWFKERFMRFFEDNRRCPNANWFELVGSVRDDAQEFFRIGRGGGQASYSPRRDGELFAFANDLKTNYGNNHGEISVTVKRLTASGDRSLPGCDEA